VENIALPAGRVKGLLKTGAQAFAGIADNGLGGEALIAQFENANGPGITVAVLFLAKEIAIGARDIDADQNRVAGLKDLIVSANQDGGQILARVDELSDTDPGAPGTMLWMVPMDMGWSNRARSSSATPL